VIVGVADNLILGRYASLGTLQITSRTRQGRSVDRDALVANFKNHARRG
jgi:hypothetical protein